MIVRPKVIKSAFLLLALSSCSKAQDILLDKSESLCRAAIREKLINPETAEFYDFKPGVKTAYGNSVLRNSMDEFQRQYPGMDGQAILLMALQRVMDYGNKRDITFHSIRVKSAGRLGNKITSEMQCASSLSSCDCQKTVEE
jgi:hypothetical protein